jgi:hypothetical protein
VEAHGDPTPCPHSPTAWGSTDPTLCPHSATA